ncbi:MAG: hypothetical protein R3F36_14290 [Candidatus Competibacteraceae bacterium]
MNRSPEAVLVSLDQAGLPDPDAVRVALAVSLFSKWRRFRRIRRADGGKPLPDLLALLSSPASRWRVARRTATMT